MGGDAGDAGGLRRIPGALAPANAAFFLAHRREDDAIVGFLNISEIIRGRLQSAFLGYGGVAGYAGHGYMREALELVLREAFTTLGLHRLEVNIQPGNRASIALAEALRLRARGLLGAVPEDRRPLARPRALGDPRRDAGGAAVA